MKKWYKQDLAYIHDTGFRDYALKSAPGILEILHLNKIYEGLIVDLGCGSGLLAQEFIKANYHVFGVDISQSMIDIARKRVPNAQFLVESLFQVEIPSCNAVVSIGECLNYLFDTNNDKQALVNLFHRIHQALAPGGVFIFDIAESGQVSNGISKHFTEGENWIVLVEKQEDIQAKILTRRIITLRQVGEHYRRDDEIHYLRLYERTEIAKELLQIGFQVKIMNNYGQFNLPKAHAAFIALFS
ncbi:MAG: class I SAM-dependent methyltransferase [Nostocaceae cyanobacterium]|nr:class I SAM-dependent methyltransferase [Nostocaceae cyanobacterium]